MFKKNNLLFFSASILVSLLFVFISVGAATTISTNVNTGGTLTVTDTSTLTGAVTMGTDLTVTSGARIGADASGGHITALANDSLFVEGQSEFDGITWFDGSLRASSTLMVTDSATLFSTLNVSGLTTLANASSTNLSASGALWVGGNATTTSAGAISTNSTLSVTSLATFLGGATTTSLTLLNGEVISNGTDGVIQLGGVASTTSITLLNGETITNATDGTVQISGIASTTSLTLLNGEIISNATDGTIQLGGIASTTSLTLLNGETITNATNGEVAIGGASDTLKILGTASTSALKVGDEPAAPTINGMVFGYCSFADVTSFTASTTKYADCTTTPAGALLAGDRVFVQATSSFDSMFVITAASTTGVSTINLRVLNTGLDGVADTTLGGTSINFWAVR